MAPEMIPDGEKILFRKAAALYPWLPFRTLDLLIVRRIGKNISGTCMDTNLIGRMGVWGLQEPEKIYATGGSAYPSTLIEHIVALDLTDESHGNAIGVGMADFITARLRNAIDEEKTVLNALTTGEMDRAKIPATLATDEALCRRLVERYGAARWVFIDTTLHLQTLYVSADLADELAGHPRCRVEPEPVPLHFERGILALPFPTHT